MKPKFMKLPIRVTDSASRDGICGRIIDHDGRLCLRTVGIIWKDTGFFVAAINACQHVNPDAIPIMLEVCKLLVANTNHAHARELAEQAIRICNE